MVATPEQTATTDVSATTTTPTTTTRATPDPLDTPSPVLANVVVILGFALVFTTFLTDSPWSWIIGGVLIVAGALWAGFTDGDRPTAARGVHDDGHAG